MIHTVAIIYNHRIAEAVSLSHQLQRMLQDLGKDIWLVKAQELDQPLYQSPSLDLIVTLGGDGTILRAARLAAPQQALVLGINLGQLGFLAELGPDDVLPRVASIVSGAGWIEERMMLRAVVHCNDKDAVQVDGLNDVVVTRGGRPRAVRLSVTIDAEPLLTYVADGIIVSTPTGSTAYALAMDGPIVHPEIRSLQLTAIAPHLAVIKSIVLPASVRIGLTIHTKDPAVASVDGQIDIPLGDGDTVEVTASPYVARFVRLQPRGYFCQTLVSRLSTTIARGLV